MENRAAFVIGAGSGIGRAIALCLAREGVSVVVADADVGGSEETVRRVEAVDGRAASFLVDVTSGDAVRGALEFAEERFGGLDVLVNNAGGAPGPHFPFAEPDHWGRTLELRAVMLCTQLATPAMRRGGGVVVNISSMAGVGSRPYGMPEYAASNAAVIRPTSALAYLKEEAGIRVNCVCPGWVETPAVRRALAGMTEEERAAQDMPPSDILMQPEEI